MIFYLLIGPTDVWMWKLDYKESWVLKNWCFWTVVLEKSLERPLDCKEIHQSILKETSPEYSLERLMLKLKLQYFGHLMQRSNSLEKTLMLGKIESRRRKGWQRIRWLDGITDSMDMSFLKLREMVKNREVWCAAVHGITKSQTPLSNWTTTTSKEEKLFSSMRTGNKNCSLWCWWKLLWLGRAAGRKAPTSREGQVTPKILVHQAFLSP